MPTPPMSRQPVFGRAAVSSSQPLASAAGLRVLAAGGNAADAAVAVAAVLAVTEPTSNGIGGDFVALHHCAADGTTKALLGIGASPAALRPADFVQRGAAHLHPPPTSGLTVTVPGAVAAWFDLKRLFGSPSPDADADAASCPTSMYSLLQPAVRAGRDGFYVHGVTAALWAQADGAVLAGTPFEDVPRQGDLFRNPDLAHTLDEIAQHGPDAFYRGPVADAIVSALANAGAPFMSAADLAAHRTEVIDPLTVDYAGWTVMEPGAPTHGAVALLALKVYALARARLGVTDGAGDEADRMHVLVEAVRASFREGAARIGDSEGAARDTADMAEDDELAAALADAIDLHRRRDLYGSGQADGTGGETAWKGGTVQFCVVDAHGNAVSAVQSNYQGFGTGIVPAGYGFSLQNRGLNFSVDPGHSNAVAGGKRPYHTIMPGMLRRGRAVTAFGVMGSFMQPQGHVRVATALVDARVDAQTALDLARFRVTGPFSGIERGMGGDRVLLEGHFDRGVATSLAERGQQIETAGTECFGRGHVCTRDEDGRVCGGADCRADGVAVVWM